MNHMLEIDDTDLRLLDVLKHNARLSTRQLAEKTKIPMATVNRRLKKMVETGVIKEFSAILDYEKLGLKTLAYVFIRSIPGADQSDVLEAASKLPEVEDIAAIAGQFDILIKIRVKDTDALSEFLFKHVRNFPSVAATETFIGLNLKPYMEMRKKPKRPS
jgi:Lrp/AsnC family transcriptional regulator, leucine-responsive regulatory protein